MAGADDMQRAEKPRAPQPSAAVERERAADRAYVTERERVERRSVARGLVVLAVVVLIASMARAGMDRVFVHGWWRQW
jgi:hypothetical protein